VALGSAGQPGLTLAVALATATLAAALATATLAVALATAALTATIAATLAATPCHECLRHRRLSWIFRATDSELYRGLPESPGLISAAPAGATGEWRAAAGEGRTGAPVRSGGAVGIGPVHGVSQRPVHPIARRCHWLSLDGAASRSAEPCRATSDPSR